MDKRIKGITVEIGGNTVGLQKSLEDVDKKSRNLNGELREINRGLKFDPSNTVLLGQKQQILAEKIETTSERLKRLKDAQAEINQKFANGEIGAEAYRAYQREVENTEGQLRSLRGQFDELTGAVSNETQAVEECSDVADNSDEKFKKLESTAKAVGTALAAATVAIGTAAIATGKEIIKLADQTAQAGDTIDKNSQAAGMSATTYQEWGYVLDRNGASIDNLATWTKKLNNVVDDANNGSAKAIEKFDKLGISVDDLAKKSREDVFADVITGLQGMTNESERAALVNDLLGGSATDLGALLNSTAEDTQALKENAQALGLVMSDDTVANSAAYEDALTDLQGAFTGIKNSIAAEVLPGLTDMMHGLTGLMTGDENAKNQLTEGFEEITEAISNVVDEIAQNAEPLIGIVGNMANDFLTAFLNNIGNNLPAIIDVVTKLSTTLLTVAITILPTLIDGAISLLKNLIDEIVKNLPQIIPVLIDGFITVLKSFATSWADVLTTVVDSLILLLPEVLPMLIDSIADFIISSVPQLVETGVTLLTSIVRAMPTIIGSITKKLPTIIASIVDTFFELLPDLVYCGVTLFMALVENLPIVIKQICDLVPDIVDAIAKNLGKLLPQLAKAGVSLFMAIVDNMPQIIVDIGKSVKTLANNILDILRDKISEFVNVGYNLITGLWDGISDAAGWLKDSVLGLMDDVTSGIKEFFGIHSPSRLFRDEIGKNLALGVGVGFADTMSNVTDDMVDSLPTSFDMSPQLNIQRGDRRLALADSAPSFAKISGANQNNGNVINFTLQIDTFNSGTGDMTRVNELGDTIMSKLYELTQRRVAVY